jgi:hypothetical protein
VADHIQGILSTNNLVPVDLCDQLPGSPLPMRLLWVVASLFILMYGECMARMISTTIRLNKEDVRALKRARAAGHSASELVRKGLRVVASRYYTGRRPPSTLLFESTDTKLGDESELFRDLED